MAARRNRLQGAAAAARLTVPVQEIAQKQDSAVRPAACTPVDGVLQVGLDEAGVLKVRHGRSLVGHELRVAGAKGASRCCKHAIVVCTRACSH